MYLNTPTIIYKAVLGCLAYLLSASVQNRIIDTPRIGLSGRTPECKLNSGFLHTKHHTFSCMGAVL